MQKPTLISVDDAHAAVLGHARRMDSEEVDSARAQGRILAQTVHADRAHPPFDRVAMDGIALRVVDLATRRTFREQAFQPAGAAPLRLDGPGECIRVATGSILPEGADAVVQVELLRPDGSGSWTVLAETVREGANIHRLGGDLACGAVVADPGRGLDAAALGALATFGATAPRCARIPSVALVCTGDEIVPPDRIPSAWQIRASHPATLLAALHAAGFADVAVHLCSDAPGALEALLARLPPVDVLLCTGGVSVGERDRVPASLEDAGFRRVFHGVSMKPGKPLWFGIHDSGRSAFGLPGNPVSALVALVRFAIPHLRARLGDLRPDRFLRLPLENPPSEDSRTRFLAASLVDHPDGTRVRIVRGNGSGDLPGLLGAAGFVEIPPGPVSPVAAYRGWA